MRSEWDGRYHILTDTLAFISPSESDRVIVTEDICESPGMSEDGEKTNGVVAEIAYSTIDGFTTKSLWEWLRKVSA